VSPIPAIIRHRAAASRVSPGRVSRWTGFSSGEIDAAVRQALREFGGVYEVDTERLAAVAPDLLLTQGVCEVCAVPTRDAAAAATGLASCPSVLASMPTTWRASRDDSPRGAAGGVPERAEQCVRDIERRIAAIRARVASRPHLASALEWLDPPFVPGTGCRRWSRWPAGTWSEGPRAGPRSAVRWEEWPVWIPTCCFVMHAGSPRRGARRRGSLPRVAVRVAPRAIRCARRLRGRCQRALQPSRPRVADGVELRVHYSILMSSPRSSLEERAHLLGD